MKVPLKNRATSVVEGIPKDFGSYDYVKVFEYAHSDKLLGEIAGHVFNSYLKFRKEENVLGTSCELRFGSTNPHKAALFVRSVITDLDKAQSRGRIKEEVMYENMCQELFYKAFEAIDKVHKLDGSFFDRIKYVFKK